MIRSRNTIRKPIPLNLLIASDQILISIIDAVIAIAFFVTGLAMIIGDQPKIVVAVGIILLAMAGIYSLSKNVFFRSIGCLLKKSCYVQAQKKESVPLWLKISVVKKDSER